MIKIVCAWCGKVIREGAPGVKLVTHLICPECFEEEMRRFEEAAQGKDVPPPQSPRYYQPPEP